MNPTIIDHSLFTIFAVVFPLWALRFGFRRLRVATREELPRVRRSVYRVGMAIQWTLTIVVLVHWFTRLRSASSLGLAPRLTPGLAGVVIGLLIVAGFLVRQRNQAMSDDDSLAQVRDRMRHIEAMLPRNGRELQAFFRLSITAGVCEEIMYRGFMIWYLSNWLEVVPAAAVASLLFGFGHAYQGWRGVVLTAAVGGFLAAVYLVTGSLYPGMIVHALMDMHSGHLAMVAFRREDDLQAEEAARLEAGLRALAAQQQDAAHLAAPADGDSGHPAVEAPPPAAPATAVEGDRSNAPAHRHPEALPETWSPPPEPGEPS